jgi:hypothetical protein
MKCPKCGAEMTYYEGEDEFGGDILIPYSYWFCAACGHWINDYEDEFEYPDKPKSPDTPKPAGAEYLKGHPEMIKLDRDQYQRDFQDEEIDVTDIKLVNCYFTRCTLHRRTGSGDSVNCVFYHCAFTGDGWPEHFSQFKLGHAEQ